MKTLLCAALILPFASSLVAQQVGTVDLTHAPKFQSALPFGCAKLLPGVIGDSVPPHDDHKPRKIVVEIIKLNMDKAPKGSELQAEVRLQNTGEEPIQIPWSADPGKAFAGQQPDHLEWSEGRFDVFLRDRQAKGFSMKSLTYGLYGSSRSPETLLALRSGQWITAMIRFKVEDEYPVPGRTFDEGESQLQVRWEQTEIFRNVDPNCSTSYLYVHYDHYYHQQLPTTTFEIAGNN